jgi:hypothetical protein
MKKYLIKDTIKAEPMTLDEFSRTVRKSEAKAPDVEGYYIQYRNGKTTWLDKANFENTAVQFDNWKDRLFVERVNLTNKAMKLREAIADRRLDDVPDTTKAILDAQLGLMEQYDHILSHRCKASIEGTSVPDLRDVPFGTALEALKQGWPVTRLSWIEDGKKRFIVRQQPCCVDKDTIPNMASLFCQTKTLMKKAKVPCISYIDQCISIDGNFNANSWSPSVEDIFADDWAIVTVPETIKF